MKEQIIEILRDQISIKSKKSLYQLAAELESLFQQEYLNSCIEKATPALSKIKDVDKELAEIRGENNCNNCKWGKCLTKDWPCNDCKWGKCLTKDWPCNDCKWGICLTKDWPCFDCDGSNKWEPIKTE